MVLTTSAANPNGAKALFLDGRRRTSAIIAAFERACLMFDGQRRSGAEPSRVTRWKEAKADGVGSVLLEGETQTVKWERQNLILAAQASSRSGIALAPTGSTSGALA